MVALSVIDITANNSYAQSVTIDNVVYNIDTSTNEATCMGAENKDLVINNLVIPDFVNYNGWDYPVTTIWYDAFISNENLQGTLSLGNNIVTIKDWAFAYCSGLTGSLVIPNSVRIIEYNAFLHCRQMTGTLTLGDSVEIIGQDAFGGCSGFTGNLVIPNSVKIIEAGGFDDCPSFSSLKLGESVEYIGPYAFSECYGFKGSLRIPDKVRNIDYGAFNLCTGFDGELYLGKSIEKIGSHSFYSCGFTGDLIIPESVVFIAYEAFSGTDFSHLIIEGQPEFERYAFLMRKLETVTCLSLIPPVYKPSEDRPEWDNNGFINYNIPLYVPKQSEQLYRTAVEWKKFKNINPPDEVEAIDIIISPSDLTLFTGQSATIQAIVIPEETTDKTISWTSSDNRIVTVNQNGIVTALAPGNATVTAACGNVSSICNIKVIDRPQTPSALLRKGDGSSCTFIAMMDIDDIELEELNYNFVYGYTNSRGNEQMIENTNFRYTHTSPEIYNNKANDFWVFAYWINTDGSVVCSQRRHLDGSVDDDFNPTDFINTQTRSKDERIIGIYTLEGQFKGKDISALESGIYVVKTTSSSYKIVK